MSKRIRICSVEGCSGRCVGWSYCSRHYQKNKVYGSPLGAAPPKPKRYCSIDGCDRVHRCKGFCALHYRKLMKLGDPLASYPPKKKGAPKLKKLCKVDGCESYSSSREYCTRHYYHWRRYGNAERPNMNDPLEIKLPRLINKDTPTDCWYWLGSIGPKGYGTIMYNNKGMRAHRLVYEFYVGEIPEGLVLDHTCHNKDPLCLGGNECLHRCCVRISHLEAVPQKVNNARGKTITANNARKTHCKHGHPFNEENTYISSNGHRICIICYQNKMRKQGKVPGGKKGRKKATHCPQGHPYDEENTYITPQGFQSCRICRREADIRSKMKRRGLRV